MVDAAARAHLDAARVATTAGRALLAARGKPRTRGTIAREARRVSQRRIAGALHALYPGDSMQVATHDVEHAGMAARRVWIVDPLDGARELDENRSDWSIDVALAVDGRIVAAAVAVPALDVTVSTRPGHPVAPPPARRPRILVSRTRPPAIAVSIAAALDGDLVAMGSAGAKATAVVSGEADVYAHLGNAGEWPAARPPQSRSSRACMSRDTTARRSGRALPARGFPTC